LNIIGSKATMFFGEKRSKWDHHSPLTYLKEERGILIG
jgi:hypothetical protein